MKGKVFFKSAICSVIILSVVGCSSHSFSSLFEPTSKMPLTYWQPDTTYRITLLHTNDNHGRFWQNKYGEYGMAARKTLIDSLRAQAKARGSEVILLSGGDINTGVPESDLLDAEPDFKGMSKIGYDAMALGNHEFDNPLSVLEQQQKWANFPLLSANIYDKKTQKNKFLPYKILNKNNLRIAIIGLTTEDTAKIVNPEFVKSLDFKDPKVEAKKLIAKLKKQENPDIIIALTHMGHYENGKHGANAPGDVALARFLDKGALDVIVGGHSQEPVCMEGENINDSDFKAGDKCVPDKQNDTWIMQAHEWGKYVGKAEFEFRNGELSLKSYELIPVNLKHKINLNGKEQRVFVDKQIVQDEELYRFLKPYQDKGQDKLAINIAKTNGKLEGDRSHVRFKQTNLGRLIAASHKDIANADFAIMNSGGVRSSIEKGDISYKDVLEVQPFGNTITYTDMTGREILSYLNVVATKPIDSGAYAQFYGVSMQVGTNGVKKVKIGGKPLNLNKTYRFTVPYFNALGGDGYPNISTHPNHVNTGFVDAQVLKEYLEKNSPIDVNDYAVKDEIIYL